MSRLIVAMLLSGVSSANVMAATEHQAVPMTGALLELNTGMIVSGIILDTSWRMTLRGASSAPVHVLFYVCKMNDTLSNQVQHPNEE